MLLGILDHAVDLFLGKARAVLDLDGVFLTGPLILGGHVNNAVGVDVEGDLNLGNATRCRCDAAKLEGAQQLIGRSHLALTLEDLNLHRGLVIFCSGEGFGLLGGDGGVALDELSHHAALGFNAEGERGDIKK